MTITVTYQEHESSVKTERFENVDKPAITKAGFLIILEVGGRPLTEIPLGRIVRIDHEDNQVVIPRNLTVQ